MIKDEIRSILKTLLEKSEAKQVPWVPFEGADPDSDDYIVSFPKSSVNLFRNKEGDIRANLLNSAGTVVGYISSSGAPVADSTLLKELFDCARESVLNADETIEDIRRALAGKDLVGGGRKTPATEEEIPF